LTAQQYRSTAALKQAGKYPCTLEQQQETSGDFTQNGKLTDLSEKFCQALFERDLNAVANPVV